MSIEDFMAEQLRKEASADILTLRQLMLTQLRKDIRLVDEMAMTLAIADHLKGPADEARTLAKQLRHCLEILQ